MAKQRKSTADADDEAIREARSRTLQARGLTPAAATAFLAQAKPEELADLDAAPAADDWSRPVIGVRDDAPQTPEEPEPTADKDSAE
jgi:hypothetical protein